MFEYLKDLIDPPIKNHRIFFFHIAKCGGTSVSNAIVSGYKPWRPAHVNTVVTLDEEAARFADENTMGNGHHVRRDLLNYMMSLSQVKCISGHFQYSNIAHEVYGDQWEFVTVLRDPIDRWFSHYNYNTRERAPPKFKIEIPLEEFVETSLAASFGRAFVDEVTEDVDKENIGIDELCERAIDRYKRFSLIGAIENSAGFTRKFEEKFGHKLKIKHLNKSQMPDDKKHRNISADVLQRVSELCEPDIYLYKELAESCGYRTN